MWIVCGSNGESHCKPSSESLERKAYQSTVKGSRERCHRLTSKAVMKLSLLCTEAAKIEFLGWFIIFITIVLECIDIVRLALQKQ